MLQAGDFVNFRNGDESSCSSLSVKYSNTFAKKKELNNFDK